jgi:glutathione peroxidase
LYSKYNSEGFEVLAFPSNSFFQEPGNNSVIKDFVKDYNVTFPMFDKVDVNGKNAHPLFEFLKGELPDFLLGLRTEAIKWNFTKVRKNCLLNGLVFN